MFRRKSTRLAVLAAVLAVLALLFVEFDTAALRLEAEAALSALLDREVRMDKLSARLLPKPCLTVRGLRVAGDRPDGPPLMTLDYGRAVIFPLDLLKGELRFKRLDIRGAGASVAVNPSRKTNWDALMANVRKKAHGDHPLISALAPAHVHVRDSGLELSDPAGPSIRFSKIALTLDPKADGGFDLGFDFARGRGDALVLGELHARGKARGDIARGRLAVEKTTATAWLEGLVRGRRARISLEADLSSELDRGRLSLDNLVVNATGITARAQANATEIFTHPVLAGMARMDLDDPDLFFSALDSPVPPALAHGGEASVNFVLSSGETRFDNIRLKADKAEIHGRVAVQRTDPAAYFLRLHGSGVRIHRWTSLAHAFSNRRQRSRPPLDRLARLNLDLEVDLRDYSWLGIGHKHLHSRVKASDGRLREAMLNAVTPGGSLEYHAQGVFKDKRVSLGVSLRIMDTGKRTVAGATLDLDGNMASWTGQGHIPAFDPRRAIRALGLAPPEGLPEKILRRASASLAMAGGTERITLERGTLTLDDMRMGLTGAMWNWAEPQAEIQVKLNRLDLDGYAGLAASRRGRDQNGWLRRPLGGNGYLNIRMNGNVRVDEVALHGWSARNATARFNYSPGNLAVPKAGAMVLDAEADASGSWRINDSGHQAFLRFHWLGIDASKLPSAMTGKRSFTGLADASAALASNGSTPLELVANTRGNATLSCKDLAVRPQPPKPLPQALDSARFQLDFVPATPRKDQDAAWNFTATAKAGARDLDLDAAYAGDTALALANRMPQYFKGRLNLKAEGLPLPGPDRALRLGADVDILPVKKEILVGGLNATLAGFDLAVPRARLGMKPRAATSGTLVLPSFAPRDLLKTVNSPYSPSNATALAHARGSIDFVLGADQTRLENIDILLDGSRLTGKAAIARLSPPAATFDLAISALNTSDYLPAHTANSSSTPLSLPKGWDLDGRVAVADLTAAGVRARNATVSTRLAKRSLRVAANADDFCSGTLRAVFKTRETNDTLLTSLDLNATDFSAGQLLLDLTGEEHLTGNATLNARAQALGRSPQAMLRTVNGTIFARLDSGKLIIDDTTRQAIDKAGGRPKSGPLGDISQAKATFRLNNGILSTKNLQADCAALSVSGNGYINLPKDYMKSRLEITFADLVVVPVAISGPLGNLTTSSNGMNALTETTANLAKSILTLPTLPFRLLGDLL